MLLWEIKFDRQLIVNKHFKKSQRENLLTRDVQAISDIYFIIIHDFQAHCLKLTKLSKDILNKVDIVKKESITKIHFVIVYV